MFVKIADPDKPGDFLVLAKAEFIEGQHVLFAEPSTEPAAPAATSTPPVAPVAPSTQPPVVNVATMTIAEAIPVIDAASRVQVEAMQAQETARTPPRAGILKALAARLEALTPQT